MADARNHEIADFMLSRTPFDLGAMYVEEIDTIRYLNEEGVWIDTPEPRLREAALDAVINHSARNPSPGILADIISVAKMRTPARMKSSICWHVRFADGTVDLRTFEKVEDDPKKYPAIYRIPYAIKDCLDPKRPTPKMLKTFLESTLVEKGETEPSQPLIDIVQELFGLCLYPKNPTEKAVFFYGTGANGKSVMCNLLTTMLGEERVSPLSLMELTQDKFLMAEIASKLANICQEEQSKFVDVGKFRKLTTGEPVMAQRKFGHPFTFTPRCKFVFAVNNLPTFDGGLDYSVLRRLLIIGFHRTFTSKIEDYAQKIFDEDPAGVYAWALRGLRRLQERKWDIDPHRSQNIQAMELDYARANSNAVEYLLANWRLSDTKWVSIGDLYALYRDWSNKNGFKAKSQRNFSMDVRRAFPNVKDQARRFELGVRARGRNLEPIPEVTDEDIEQDKDPDPFDALTKKD